MFTRGGSWKFILPSIRKKEIGAVRVKDGRALLAGLEDMILEVTLQVASVKGQHPHS